jgi:ferrous iron transport protein B
MKKILLMGNPNVGKSVIFSRLTGMHVISSNYPGTTVEFTEGKINFKGEKAKLIDVPGTYTLNPTCTAEEIAAKMVEEGDLIINVIDATHLERNLFLTLQLLERKKPLIIALNIWDETKHKGISINIKKLEKELGVPIIPTVGPTGEGIKKLVANFEKAKIPHVKKTQANEKWQKIGEIIKKVQKIKHRHHTLKEKFRDLTIKSWFGLPFAFLILITTFILIRYIGEGLIGYIFEPIFENFWSPIMLNLSKLLEGNVFLHDILIGKLINSQIDYVQSLGLLTTGLFVPLAMVLPYVFSFYLILSFLEDIGYLPRLAVLMDNIMHKVGLHGCAIIPMFLGLGCNVPGALSTRILETKREKFIALTLMSISVPCMAQTAMIIGLIGSAGIKGILWVFGTLIVVWFLLGLIMNKLIKGESPEIFTEIPPYRMPYLKAVFKKVWMRVKGFLKEAIPYVLLGVLIINILYSFGIIQIIGNITAPVITGVLGLPKEAVGALIIGFLRKDVAVGMLLPLGLTISQLIVASVVLAMYFPCVATFAVLLKELKIIDTIKASVIMIISALLTGGFLNLIFLNLK